MPSPSDLDDEDIEYLPSTPEVGMSDDEVENLEIEYSIRAPGDWVISGPLGAHGGGPGRRFATVKQAEAWVREKYQQRVKYRIPEATTNGGNRWAWLIKGAQ